MLGDHAAEVTVDAVHRLSHRRRLRCRQLVEHGEYPCDELRRILRGQSRPGEEDLRRNVPPTSRTRSHCPLSMNWSIDSLAKRLTSSSIFATAPGENCGLSSWRYLTCCGGRAGWESCVSSGQGLWR